LWFNQDLIRCELQQTIPRVQEKSLENFYILRNLYTGTE